MIKKILNIAGYTILIIFALHTAYRLYLFNGSSYPAWLAKRDLGTLTFPQIDQFVSEQPECRGAAILDKSEGLRVIVCGDYFFQIYIAHR